MDKLKEYFRHLPKWAWIAIGAAILLVLFLARRNKATAVPTVASLSKDQAGSLAAGTTQADSSYGVSDQIVSALNQVAGTIQQNQVVSDNKINELAGHVNEVNSAINNQNQTVLDFFKYQKEPKMNPVNEVVSSVFSSGSQEPEHENNPIVSGAKECGGFDFNTASNVQKIQALANAKRLENDHSYAVSELSRSAGVIADKTTKHEDISAQVKYLNEVESHL